MPTLREARIHKMLTIRELAKRAGVSPTTIQASESGQNLHFGTMRKISAALGVEPSEITEFQEVIERTSKGKEAA